MSRHGPACACCDTQLIPTWNARKRPSNPLRADPTRTAGLRRAFLAEVNRRFAALRKAIRVLVVEEDAFGLKQRGPLKFNAEPRRWQFLTSDKKLGAFNTWLDQQVQAGVLTVTPAGNHWSAQYVESAYKKGVIRAWVDTHRKELGLSEKPDFYEGSQAEFLRQSFGGPEALSKIRLIATRPYEGLKGITSNMSANMSRILAGGLANGHSPLRIANDLADSMGLPIARARTIARTEVMHAHAEGQLDSFEALGVDELGVMAEWSTAGFNVCPVCEPLEGTILTVKEARGMIPRHPNCRCTWIPANVTESEKGQKRTKGRINAAIKKSLTAEASKQTRKRGPEAVRASSRWVGADKTISGKASQTPPKK